MQVILLDEAQRQLEAEDTWWRRHRDAKDLVLHEFEQALRLLADSPESGQVYRLCRGYVIRRWLLSKTHCRGARRGRGPSL